jgi:hypothetical protein
VEQDGVGATAVLDTERFLLQQRLEPAEFTARGSANEQGARHDGGSGNTATPSF